MRLFIGVPVPPSDKYALVVRQLQTAVKNARPAGGVPHVTLRFLGEMLSADAVIEAVGQAVEGRPALPAVVEGIGAFPDAKRARILWAGVRAPGIEGLARAVEDATAGIGKPPERRPFVAHVTLARIPSPADMRSLIDIHKDTLFGQGTLDRVVLFRSVLGPGGSGYHRLREFPLGQAPVDRQGEA